MKEMKDFEGNLFYFYFLLLSSRPVNSRVLSFCLGVYLHVSGANETNLSCRVVEVWCQIYLKQKGACY